MTKNRFVELSCLDCHAIYDPDTHSLCAKCGEILSAVYDVRRRLVRNSSLQGIWNYKEFFPPVADENIVSLGEGRTALVEARRYSESLGKNAPRVFCKLEGSNPTGAFKDRIASLGLSLAKAKGKRGVFTASSGNAAASTAAYSARAGLGCLILVREDASVSKVTQIASYAPKILRVRDLYKTKE